MEKEDHLSIKKVVNHSRYESAKSRGWRGSIKFWRGWRG